MLPFFSSSSSHLVYLNSDFGLWAFVFSLSLPLFPPYGIGLIRFGCWNLVSSLIKNAIRWMQRNLNDGIEKNVEAVAIDYVDCSLITCRVFRAAEPKTKNTQTTVPSKCVKWNRRELPHKSKTEQKSFNPFDRTSEQFKCQTKWFNLNFQFCLLNQLFFFSFFFPTSIPWGLLHLITILSFVGRSLQHRFFDECISLTPFTAQSTENNTPEN